MVGEGSAPPAFEVQPWLAQDARHRTSGPKRAAHWMIRAAGSAGHARRLRTHVPRYEPDLVIGARGFSIDARRRWATSDVSVRDATVLVQGTGSGWDVLGWARLGPKRIVAVDLFAFDSWPAVADYCGAQYRVPVDFFASSLTDLSAIDDASVDICVSDAVLEHCTDLDAVLRESHRVLVPDGRLYASYGPLWFGPGGDHFSGRGGLEHIYAHVALDPDSYGAYFDAHREAVEDFQSGGRYVELDLFSKLTTGEYLAAMETAGFEREALVLEIGPEAVKFRDLYPDRFARLLHRYDGRCVADDFLVKGNVVRLRKR